jgi:hypothetical protein
MALPETFTKEDLREIATYIQKKERLISALNSAVRTAEAPIYGQALNDLIVLLLEDKLLPESYDTSMFFPELYPRQEKKKEKQAVSSKGSGKEDPEDSENSEE